MQAGWCASGRTGSSVTVSPSKAASAGGWLRQAPRLTLALLTLPVVAGLAASFAPAFAGNGEGFRLMMAWPGLGPALILSLKTGLISTALALAVTLGLIAGLGNSRTMGLIQHALAPLLSVPHAAAALGLAFLIAPSGWLARLISPWPSGWEVPPDLLILNDPGGWALILGLVAKEVPFLLLMSLAALPQTDAARRSLQAQSLGAGRVAGFLIAVLPALYTQLRLPVYAVLAYAATAVEMALILGPTRPPTLAVQIVTWMADPSLAQRPAAAAAALILSLAVLALIAFWAGAERLAARALRALAFAGWRGTALDGPVRLVALVAGPGLGLMMTLGLAGLALWSFAGLWPFPLALPESLGLRTWAQALPDLLAGSAMTLALALASTGAALVLVLACLEAEARHGLHPGPLALWLLYLPLIVPQIAFLPGLQRLALGMGLPEGPVAVALSHLTFVLPYVFLSLAQPYRAWDARIGLTAQSLGASPARVFWRLRLPMLLAPVLTATAVGLAVSIGQYLPTLLIGGGRVETVTTEAVALSSGGNRRLIGAYGLMQMVLPMLGFALALALPALIFRNRRALQRRV